MSGRGKGAKGLGKGGLRRKKSQASLWTCVKEDNVEGVRMKPTPTVSTPHRCTMRLPKEVELLRAGADPLLLNAEGLTVLDVARQTAGASDMLPLLEDAVTKHAGATSRSFL